MHSADAQQDYKPLAVQYLSNACCSCCPPQGVAHTPISTAEQEDIIQHGRAGRQYQVLCSMRVHRSWAHAESPLEGRTSSTTATRWGPSVGSLRSCTGSLSAANGGQAIVSGMCLPGRLYMSPGILCFRCVQTVFGAHSTGSHHQCCLFHASGLTF